MSTSHLGTKNDHSSNSLYYFAVKYWDEEGEARVNHYPFLTSGPWTTFIVVGCYLYFVKIAGPSMMKSRPAMELKQLMIFYNFLMVALSTWMSFEAFFASNFTLSAWSCKESQRITSSTDAGDDILFRRGAFVLWVFFFSKFFEFLDTIFMILRKKKSQVTALHVIHHSIVPVSIWFGAKFSPTPINMWFPFLNSAVHAFMYSYYGLMALEASLSDSHKKQLRRFKPWITRIQIIQFCLAISQVVYLITNSFVDSSCEIPYSYLIPNLGNGVLFLVLFLNFYYEAYLKKSSKTEKSIVTSVKNEDDSNNNLLNNNNLLKNKEKVEEVNNTTGNIKSE